MEEREREAAAGWQRREGELAGREQALLAERQALEEAAAEFEVRAGEWWVEWEMAGSEQQLGSAGSARCRLRFR